MGENENVIISERFRLILETFQWRWQKSQVEDEEKQSFMQNENFSNEIHSLEAPN